VRRNRARCKPAARYEEALRNRCGNSVTRDLCVDAQAFAGLLAYALKNHPAAPPSPAPKLTKTLQGNLTEFGVWDLGERYWSLYRRRMTWTANADSPWKASSSDGIDILALSHPKMDVLLVIEVKSSEGAGANLVTGGASSLQSDFDRLFQGPVQNRLSISVGRGLASLRLVHQRPDLEEHVKSMVGAKPADCQSVKLVGVLVCSGGDHDDQRTRERAFGRLVQHLAGAGWHPSQLECHAIEVDDLKNLLAAVIDRATA
jgi:hypothetical protein